MAKLGIAILAWKRPDYLYITLDGLFRARGIEKCLVNVYFEGTAYGELDVPLLRERQAEVTGQFPVDKVVYNREQKGILSQFLTCLQDCFDDGCDHVLLMWEDVLIRTDAIEYLFKAQTDWKGACFYSLQRVCLARKGVPLEPAGYSYGYDSIGIMIGADTFKLVSDWINAKAYLGLIYPSLDKRIYECDWLQFRGHDTIVASLALEHKLVRLVPEMSYCAHFGLCACREDLNSLHPEIAQVEKIMLAGSRETWVDNVATLFRERPYSVVVDERLYPEGFEYA